MTSLLSFLRRDESGLLDSLLESPAATLRQLRDRVDALAELDPMAPEAAASALDLDGWNALDPAFEGDDTDEIRAANRRVISAALKDARRRLKAAEFLINTKL